MRNRIVAAAALLFFCALASSAQQNMYKLQINGAGTSATMVSLDQPNLIAGRYVFHAWPDGAFTSIPQSAVVKLTRLTGPTNDTIYRLELNPSGTLIAKDVPVLKGSTYTFHNRLGGNLMSVRASDVRHITMLSGDEAFWVIQGLEGESSIDNVAMHGTNKIVEINTPSAKNNTAQAGPGSLSDMNGPPGISGANPYGNWSYQGTPGVSDAWSPANASMRNGVPTMPAATNGMNPPTMPR
ncbi:MAG TPA: hypothetical protein VKG23_12340 [Thermoanaerobaculia bacterium]|jgi:hypothetical protein|nr:hypothetical protein [Thermoanaerobaculia bacterium]